MATIKKVFPIEGRADFYKFVILATDSKTELRKDADKKDMYFSFIEDAERVCRACNAVEMHRNLKIFKIFEVTFKGRLFKVNRKIAFHKDSTPKDIELHFQKMYFCQDLVINNQLNK